MKYDVVIAGAGLFGSVLARELRDNGRRVLVVERRATVGGNIRCEERDGIPVHLYGAHIFHTSIREVWEYVNRFAEFHPFINSPVANYKGELYNLPFNMNTFHQIWGVKTPAEARAKIAGQRKGAPAEPKNLEEQAISLVGRDIYEKLIKGYTEKQWGRDCRELPAFIIRRLPLRFTYDNNYFNDRWQGIPAGGYNGLIENLLQGVEVSLGTEFLRDRDYFMKNAERIIYTGAIDEFFDYELGELEYRGLRFEHDRMETDNLQGVAVMNFTDRDTPYTRQIEHKHFEVGNQALLEQPVSIVTKEYPADWRRGDDAYYPVNDGKNQALYQKYLAKTASERVIFGGRLGEYKYYDMDKTVERALALAQSLKA
ncbi:MAG: UDP-galactopyranose mutase [Schwartzia succinivorans]|nr:UDP-galactopyranose mutase [Schwartzia succinivorans]